jgi:hypothetical protein
VYQFRLQENPDEAKIWVTSSGKDNALFSWDVWRRLPLHEVSSVVCFDFDSFFDNHHDGISINIDHSVHNHS